MESKSSCISAKLNVLDYNLDMESLPCIQPTEAFTYLQKYDMSRAFTFEIFDFLKSVI